MPARARTAPTAESPARRRRASVREDAQVPPARSPPRRRASSSRAPRPTPASRSSWPGCAERRCVAACGAPFKAQNLSNNSRPRPGGSSRPACTPVRGVHSGSRRALRFAACTPVRGVHSGSRHPSESWTAGSAGRCGADVARRLRERRLPWGLAHRGRAGGRVGLAARARCAGCRAVHAHARHPRRCPQGARRTRRPARPHPRGLHPRGLAFRVVEITDPNDGARCGAQPSGIRTISARLACRARDRLRHGWVMDTYLLQPRLDARAGTTRHKS